MRRPRISFIIGLFLIIGFICFLSGALWAKWATVEPTFFQIKITDIAQVIFPLVIAILITYFLNKLMSSTIHQREIMVKLLEQIEDKIRCIFENGNAYISNHQTSTPTPQKLAEERKIRGFIKHASSELSIFFDVFNKYDFVNKRDKDLLINRMKSNFLNIKIALTDLPFGVYNGNGYTNEQQIQFDLNYHAILCEIHRCKIDIYS